MLIRHVPLVNIGIVGESKVAYDNKCRSFTQSKHVGCTPAWAGNANIYYGMKYMGIDFGTKKVGVAFSNEDGTMAFPHDVIPNDAKLIQTVTALAEEKGVEAIVIGESLKGSGEANVVQEKIDEFIGDLTLELGIPIHLEPEQYTSKEAERIQGKTAMTDASAAAIILNSFLTKQRS